MPFSASGHAATTLQPSQPSEMESRGPSRLLEEPLPHTSPKQSTFTRNDGAVTSTGPAPREPKRLDKQSLDYILRSGLAGGLAGCAVSAVVARPLAPQLANMLNRPKLSSDPSIESRSSSKPRILISQNILGAG